MDPTSLLFVFLKDNLGALENTSVYLEYLCVPRILKFHFLQKNKQLNDNLIYFFKYDVKLILEYNWNAYSTILSCWFKIE